MDLNILINWLQSVSNQIIAGIVIVALLLALVAVIEWWCSRDVQQAFKHTPPQDPPNTIRKDGRLYGYSSRGEIVPYEPKH